MTTTAIGKDRRADDAAVPSEWGSERLDLEAYLGRLGYEGDRAPTPEALRALHRAHIAAIPFENIDIVLGRGIRLDLDSLQDKLVRQPRGGYCYEHNLLFGAALERLGYPVTRLVARVRPSGAGSRTHMLLRVEAGGRPWLADVGFGGGVLEPIPLAAGTVARQGGWTYRLDSGDDGVWLLNSLRPDGPADLYSFTVEPQRPIDYEVINYYTATHPNSPFTGRSVAMRNEEEAHYTLVDRNLSTRHPGGTVSERELVEDELAGVLRGTFGVVLSPNELAKLRRDAEERR